MPHPKVKSENYTNFGGINTKVSPYTTGPHEFLNLVNFDFQMPGSLSTRWGSTQAITSSASYIGTVNSLFEFEKTNGFSQIVWSQTGIIWYGATTGTQTSMTPGAALSATQLMYGKIGVLFDASGLTTSYLSGKKYWNDENKTINGTMVSSLEPISFLDTVMDYNNFNNKLYMASSSQFAAWDGFTMTPVADVAPLAYTPPASSFNTSVIYIQKSGTTSQFLGAAAANWGWAIYASYVYTDARESQVWPVAFFRPAAAVADTTQAVFYFTMNVPLGIGVTNINVYAAGFTMPLFDGSPEDIINNSNSLIDTIERPFYLIKQVNSGGSTLCNITLGVIGGTNVNSGNYALYNGASHMLFKAAINANTNYFEIDSNFRGGPYITEIFNNRLFVSGFNQNPSLVQYSEVGAPQVFDDGNEFEVRTNDGDVISAMVSYQNKLVIFKNNSTAELTGDGPDNFFVREVTNEYGCLANRAAVVWENQLVFLDRKGVIQYNGSQIQPISNKVQDYFDRMNVAVAKTTACMVHDKKRNQIMLAIPIDGSTVNNIVMVYDYLASAWTTYQGINTAVMAVMQGGLSSKTVHYGGYSGMFYYYGASFIGDNGSGFTGLIKTRFYDQFGKTTEGQFRRLYMNVDPVTSATIAINVNFMKNYGASVVLNRTMYANPFQSRIDFGISARSLAFELGYLSSTMQIRVHGYGLETRFQRST